MKSVVWNRPSTGVAVACMPQDCAGLAGEWPRGALDGHAPEIIPAGLDDRVGVPTGHQRRAQSNGEVGEPAQNVRRVVLAQSRIDEHHRRQLEQERLPRRAADRNHLVRDSGPPHLLWVIASHRADPLQDGLTFEDRVGERHASPARRRLRIVVDDDIVALAEQAMRDRRPDVADSTHEDQRIAHDVLRVGGGRTRINRNGRIYRRDEAEQVPGGAW
jgi:hypothetical protein